MDVCIPALPNFIFSLLKSCCDPLPDDNIDLLNTEEILRCRNSQRTAVLFFAEPDRIVFCFTIFKG